MAAGLRIILFSVLAGVVVGTMIVSWKRILVYQARYILAEARTLADMNARLQLLQGGADVTSSGPLSDAINPYATDGVILHAAVSEWEEEPGRSRDAEAAPRQLAKHPADSWRPPRGRQLPLPPLR